MRSFELANALRRTESRSKRALLDEAADCIQCMDVRIEMMEEENKRLRRRLEELGQKVPRWIPVTEQLPDRDVGDWCLVYADGQEGYVRYCGAVLGVDYDPGTGDFFDGSLCITNLVRFWMPMPEGPEEDAHG